MALPIIITLVWRSEAHGGTTGDWFNWKLKFMWLEMALRDRWRWFDMASVAAVFLVLVEALRNRRLSFSRNLAFSALVLIAGFIILPRIIFGSAYADMRLVPYMLAVLVLAIRFRGETDRRTGTVLALAGLLFCAVRLASNTVSLANRRRTTSRPSSRRSITSRKARASPRWSDCRARTCGRCRATAIWASMVTVRRDGFSNDQWLMEGLNLLELKYTKVGPFASDPSELVRPNACPDGLHLPIDRSPGLATARWVRLCLADRHAAVQPGARCRNAAGLARTRVYPLSIASMKLSIVVPCFNEEACLPALHERLAAAARGAVGEDYEIVLVNDGSRDSSWPIMQAITRTDGHVLAVNLSRNHGHQLALTAGLDLCRGDHVLIIDADLQDPPELLPQMLETMRRENADVVYGVRKSRSGETAFKRATAHGFYRLLSRATEVNIPVDAGDFRLMSRRALDAFLAMPEQARFIRGMVAWIGFKQVPFAYDRAERFAGETKYPLSKMMRFAFDALTGFSSAPLKLASHAGMWLAAGSILLIVYIAYAWLSGHSIQGWTSLMLVVVVLGAVQMFVLALMGEYIGRLYNEAKRRPLYIVQEIAGGEPHAARLGYVADATANSDKPGGKGKRPTR